MQPLGKTRPLPGDLESLWHCTAVWTCPTQVWCQQGLTALGHPWSRGWCAESHGDQKTSALRATAEDPWLTAQRSQEYSSTHLETDSERGKGAAHSLELFLFAAWELETPTLLKDSHKWSTWDHGESNLKSRMRLKIHRYWCVCIGKTWKTSKSFWRL